MRTACALPACALPACALHADERSILDGHQGEHERRQPTAARSVGIRARTNQRARGAKAPAAHRALERSHSGKVGRIQVINGGGEAANDGGVARGRRHVQRGRAVGLLDMDVGLGIDEGAHDRREAARGRVHERGKPRGILGVQMCIRAEECLYDPQMPRLGDG